MAEKKIGVIGSINTDIICKTPRLPKVGETVYGDSFYVVNGGKGANVAVAATRLGATTRLFACIGDDNFSKNALYSLNTEGVGTSAIKCIKGCTGGIASITLNNNNNSVIVVPGANAKLDKEYISANIRRLKDCGIIGGQFEVSPDAILEASEICKKEDIPFVINLSPITKFSKKIIENATYIIVNELEIAQLYSPKNKDYESTLEKYANKLIMTSGGKGVYYHDGENLVHIPALDVCVVDTTGAGDTFLGAFMFGINSGFELKKAIKFANICGGLKTTKIGAQTGMPTIKEIKNFINDKNIDLEI